MALTVIKVEHTIRKIGLHFRVMVSHYARWIRNNYLGCSWFTTVAASDVSCWVLVPSVSTTKRDSIALQKLHSQQW